MKSITAENKAQYSDSRKLAARARHCAEVGPPRKRDGRARPNRWS